MTARLEAGVAARVNTGLEVYLLKVARRGGERGNRSDVYLNLRRTFKDVFK